MGLSTQAKKGLSLVEIIVVVAILAACLIVVQVLLGSSFDLKGILNNNAATDTATPSATLVPSVSPSP
jgi:prepilin-type N-terminal cleavage/methylation domain-containing protein